MRDCDDVNVGDRLPDLLHGRLPEPERVRVQAHVDGCAACASEWRLLRASRVVLHDGAPRVNVDAIAAAVAARLAAERAPVASVAPLAPLAPPALRVVRGDGPAKAAPARSARRWPAAPLRAAAAIAVMALGVGGVAVARRQAAAPVAVDSTVGPAVPGPVAVAPGAGARAESAAAPTATAARPATSAGTVSALGATFSDLSDEELAAVIDAVESDAGLPPADSSATPALVTSGEGEAL